MKSERKFHTRPVAAVKNDHSSTTRVSALRGPMRSPSHPAGISSSAYAKKKAEKAHFMSESLRPRSFCRSGFAFDRQTRSAYVMIATAIAKAITMKRTLVGFWPGGGFSIMSAGLRPAWTAA